MTTVRLRLLVLALAPLIVLLPLLLLLGYTRWSSDYDELLTAKVESDLKVAEQYLSRIQAITGDELGAVASSLAFARAFAVPNELEQFFEAKRADLQLDFLYYLPEAEAGPAAARWPVIETALSDAPATEIDIFSSADLAELGPDLAARALIPLIETEAARPTDRDVEDRGMVIHAAHPFDILGRKGVLVGGILLNRNLHFIDTINALIYLNAVTGGASQGTATLFLEDVRVSTNVRLFEDVRALGTRVSAVVRSGVLDEGRTWLDRAFVVNDWYISGYLPLIDSFGDRVGMLYVGFLEAPYAEAKSAAIWWIVAAFLGILAISVPAFLWLARGVFQPLERMTHVMRLVGKGDLAARHGAARRRDEIGQVAAHLDDLLDQIQDRDAKLRAYADDLNDRVDRRTAELRDANNKLEETYHQLVMSEKLASIGEITAGVAHEINNPVAVIQGNVDVIREALGEDSVPVETELLLVDRQVVRIQTIVSKLLKFARPSEFSAYSSAVPLAPVVEECLVLVEHVLGKGRITVRTALGEAPMVQIDPGEIQQVVVNLLVNAAQAMEHAGTLELRLGTETRGGELGARLVVADSGPGIAAEKLDSVFDPFFTTKQAEGTGLGLSISQALIQRAGGLISARNRDTGGAAFTIWLPAADVME